MSLNLAMTLLGFGFCPNQHYHSFNKNLLSTFYVLFVIAVQLLSHVWLFVTPWTIQHARLPCPSLSPWVCSNSCQLSQWCYPSVSNSASLFSSCPQSFPLSGSFPVSRLFASGGQSIGVAASACPSNEYSRLISFRINIFDLHAIQGTLKSLIHHHNLITHWFLEPQENKICHCFHFSPSVCHEVMGPNVMILVFWMLSFKPAFSLSSFTLIKRLFSSSSLSAIRVLSSAYLRLLVFLPVILIPGSHPVSHPSWYFPWCTVYVCVKYQEQIIKWSS